MMQPLPELCWVDFDDLQIDESYQRDACGKHAKRHIQNIAENFDWRKMKPLSVSRRVCGGLFVMDGQHELEALKIRRDTHGDVGDQAPCFVHDGSDLANEADSFVAINRDRVKVHILQLHHAALMAKDPEALEIDEVCRLSGVKILRSPAANGKTPPGTTAAIGAIRQTLKRYGRAAVIQGLSAMARAYAGQEGQMRASLVRGVITFCASASDLNAAYLVEALRVKPAMMWEISARERAASDGLAITAAMCDGLESVVLGVAMKYRDRPPPEAKPAVAAAEPFDALYQGKTYEDDPRPAANNRL